MRPFEGIRVIDTTHVLAGPFAVYQLALLGADVVKIENPKSPDQGRLVGGGAEFAGRQMGVQYLTQGANKKSLTLDLKTPRGREILRQLLKNADVFTENYRPGSLEALGLGYDTLKEEFPSLIYCSLSAFGHTGPRKAQTAYDNVIQATSGMMAKTGTQATAPTKVGLPIIDYATGLMGAFALSSALFQRSRTGRGQRIDVAMCDVALALSTNYIMEYHLTGAPPRLEGNNHPHFATSGCYETKAGLLMMGGANLAQQARIWQVLGRPEMVKQTNEERLADRARETSLLAELLKARTADEWEKLFMDNHVPAARVRQMDETLRDPQFATRNMTHHLEHVPSLGRDLTVPAGAFTFEHGGPRVDTSPPALGEQTDEILGGLGYSRAEIGRLREEGII